MILIISVFVTHNRLTHLNRVDRLDLFMSTLKSYSVFDFDEIFLLVELDEEFKHRENELKIFINKIFKKVKVNYLSHRYVKQIEWRPLISYVVSKNCPVWFTQNDDHPFIGVDKKIIYNGLEFISKDNSPYSSIYLSHWTEILRLSLKFNNYKVIDEYIVFKATLLDSIQIFNPRLLKLLFLELNWNNKSFKRIDGLIVQPSVSTNFISSNHLHVINFPLQTIYVPLLEICRKFNAYTHVGMTDVEPLYLSYDIEKPVINQEYISKIINAKHQGDWTQNNPYFINKDLENKIQNLYIKKLS